MRVFSLSVIALFVSACGASTTAPSPISTAVSPSVIAPIASPAGPAPVTPARGWSVSGPVGYIQTTAPQTWTLTVTDSPQHIRIVMASFFDPTPGPAPTLFATGHHWSTGPTDFPAHSSGTLTWGYADLLCGGRAQMDMRILAVPDGAILEYHDNVMDSGVTSPANSSCVPPVVPVPPIPPTAPPILPTCKDVTSHITMGSTTATAVFVVPAGFAAPLGLASYSAPAATFALPQDVHDNQVSPTGTRTVTLTVQVPLGFWQVDAFCGDVIRHLDAGHLYSARLLESRNGGSAR